MLANQERDARNARIALAEADLAEQVDDFQGWTATRSHAVFHLTCPTCGNQSVVVGRRVNQGAFLRCAHDQASCRCLTCRNSPILWETIKARGPAKILQNGLGGTLGRLVPVGFGGRGRICYLDENGAEQLRSDPLGVQATTCRCFACSILLDTLAGDPNLQKFWEPRPTSDINAAKEHERCLSLVR